MMTEQILNPLLTIINEMSPYLLLGFLFAGLLHVAVPRGFYRRHLSGDNWSSVVKAALFGIPLPLCSCGVIPTAMSLRREGVSRSGVVAFLTSTPQTGIDSIMATYAVFGLPFAIVRPVAALVTGVLSGLLTAGVVSRRPDTDTQLTQPDQCCSASGQHPNRLVAMLRYGFVDMLQDIGGHLIVGLVVAAVITIAVPDDFFASFAHTPLLEMPIVLLLSIPMYVCATGSIPVAAALVLKGLSPGAALVFLMAGPATNMASIVVIRKAMGTRCLALYLGGLTAGALIAGILVNSLMPPQWFEAATTVHTCHTADTPWWQWVCSAVFAILLTNALVRKRTSHQHNHNKTTDMEQSVTYKVNGMSCNHCKKSVETNLGQLPGVSAVSVDLAAGTVCVQGTASADELKRIVEQLGFEFGGQA